MVDRAFAQALGVPAPVTIATALSVFDIDPEPNTVIKPASGAELLLISWTEKSDTD